MPYIIMHVKYTYTYIFIVFYINTSNSHASEIGIIMYAIQTIDMQVINRRREPRRAQCLRRFFILLYRYKKRKKSRKNNIMCSLHLQVTVFVCMHIFTIEKWRMNAKGRTFREKYTLTYTHTYTQTNALYTYYIAHASRDTCNKRAASFAHSSTSSYKQNNNDIRKKYSRARAAVNFIDGNEKSDERLVIDQKSSIHFNDTYTPTRVRIHT